MRVDAISKSFLVLPLLAFLAVPAHAQWGGGDGAQAGATAYCAARAAGKDDRQATRAASNALVNGMTGSFGSNIATIITGGSAMNDSLKYLIQRQCPEYLSTGVEGKFVKQLTSWQNYCFDNPWLRECGGQNPEKVPGVAGIQIPPEGSIPAETLKPLSAQNKSAKPSVPQAKPVPNIEVKAHNTCIKAADYAGCMKYHLAN